jgi:hypothetical protein
VTTDIVHRDSSLAELPGRSLIELPSRSLGEPPSNRLPLELESNSPAELENTSHGGLVSTVFNSHPSSSSARQYDPYVYTSPSDVGRAVPAHQLRPQSPLVHVTSQDIIPSPPRTVQPSPGRRVPSHGSGYKHQGSDASGTEPVRLSETGRPKDTDARCDSLRSSTAPRSQQNGQRPTGYRRPRTNSSLETPPAHDITQSSERRRESFFELRQAGPSASARTPDGT